MFAENRRSKLLTLGAMCFALFMVMLDNTVVNVALPSIETKLGSGVTGLQWIVDGYTLVFAALLLTGGTLGDLYGRKRTFLLGLAVFTAGSALCAVAPSIGVLIAGRAVQGVGGAALLPGTLSILTHTFPDPRERAQAIGIWAGVSALALAGGPVVGGLLVDGFGWQSVFLLNLPIGILALFVATRFVPESANPASRRLDLPGQLLGITWLSALTYALIEGNAKGWSSPLILSLFAVAAVGATAFILVERRTDHPMLQLAFFSNKTFSAANVVSFAVSFGLFGVLFFFSLYMQQVKGYSAVAAGVRFLPMTLAIVVTAPIAGRLAGRLGARLPMATGQLLAATGLLLLLGVQADTSYGSMWWKLGVIGLGMGLTMTPMTAAVMSSVPPARAGMASATLNTSRQVGGTFGIAVLGALVTSRFTSSLTEQLASARVPLGLRTAVLARAKGGGAGTSAAGPLPRGLDPVLLHRALGTAFVSGMHVAMVVAGCALLTASVVSAAFIGRHDVAAPARVAEQPVPALSVD